MNKSEEHQSESINCMVRACIALIVVTRNILLPCYLRSGTLRAVQYSLKWGTAAFLHSAGTGLPSTLLWKINFAKMKATNQGPEVINKAVYKPVQVYVHVHTQIAN